MALDPFGSGFEVATGCPSAPGPLLSLPSFVVFSLPPVAGGVVLVSTKLRP